MNCRQHQRDSLKVVVLGNGGVGKTSLVQQLLRTDVANDDTSRSSSAIPESSSPIIRGPNATQSLDAAMFHSSSSGWTDPTANTEESTPSRSGSSGSKNSTAKDTLVALNTYEWELPEQSDSYSSSSSSSSLKKLTVWDFSGQERFHAAQEMFFTPETLYIVVWDMAAKDMQPLQQEPCCGDVGGSAAAPMGGSGNDGLELEPPRPARCSFATETRSTSSCSAAFRLDYDSDSDSDDDCELDMYNQEEIRRFKRALDQDIDDKVQSWIDRIQARVPGATILPIATFADRFWTMYDCKEAKKRCRSLKERLLCHENCRYQDLKWRIQNSSSAGGHKETCRWVKSLAQRPQILFGSAQDNGEALPHQICTKDGMGMDRFREFLLVSAKALVASASVPACSSMTRSFLRDTCRSMKAHFKIVQSQYFLKQYGTESQGEIASALESLHHSGELCYFRCQAGDKNADLVILDPSWMVESVNFVLRHGLNRFSTSNIVSDASDSVCQSFKHEIRFLWKNRPRTKLGLELAEQMSQDAPDQIFDCVASLLARHDVVVPLTFCKGRKDMLTPGGFPSRVFHNENCDASCTLNCPLLHLGAANVFPRSMCHGLTFMERVPSSLMERMAVHIMKILDSPSFDGLGVRIKEFHCWNNSCNINLSTGDNGKIVIQSFLLQPHEDNSPSHAVSCKSMCVTCIDISQVNTIGDQTKEVCLSIRRGMQYALDEMPGVEYKDEGVCPDCLMNKAVGVIGTWTFPKIRTVLADEELTIRCRNGHNVDIGLVQGLIKCEFDTPKPDFKCCVPPPDVVCIDCPIDPTQLCESASIPSDRSSDGSRSLPEELRQIKPCQGLRRYKTDPASVKCPVPDVVETRTSKVASPSLDELLDEDIEKLNEAKKAIQSYESSMKKRFFGVKKPKLVLSGLQLRERHIPLKELVGTPLGHNVQHLSLSKNLFETLPPSLVVSLPNLKSLDLSGCCISDLPNKWYLPKLKKLDLSNNNLKSFPGEEMLVGMPQLEELNLRGNMVKKVKIPMHSIALRKLKNLDLSMNQISYPPKNLSVLPALKVFDMQHNPMKEVPVDIVSSMNNFLVEAVADKPIRGKKTAWTDNQKLKRSMWDSKYCSSGDESSSELKTYACQPQVKQVSLTRSTQNTVPVEDISERCDHSVF